MRHVLALMGVAALSLGPSVRPGEAQVVQAVAADANHFVEDVTDRAMASLAETSISPALRRERARLVIRDAFAVGDMARFALGRYWTGASAAQRIEYVSLFEDFLVASIAARFKKAGQDGLDLRILSAAAIESGDGTTLVRTVLYLTPRSALPVDWRVVREGSRYQVTDLIVAGVSLNHRYRAEVTSLVRRDGVPGLLAELRQVTAALNDPSPTSDEGRGGSALTGHASPAVGRTLSRALLLALASPLRQAP
ncbi:MAG: phospholipid-binding protein MlaC [Alphaproteobacteria bacterium]